ncbi:MAG: SDR family oxidoreductase [Actinobacteria bacterium]|nr:SDR family oxidoreductase [Actinomycetota bacterium]
MRPERVITWWRELPKGSSGTAIAKELERNRKTDPNYPDDWVPFIPIGRVGKVEEVAKPVVFLCSEDSSYIIGQNIYVSGGQTDYVPMPRSEYKYC